MQAGSHWWWNYPRGQNFQPFAGATLQKLPPSRHHPSPELAWERAVAAPFLVCGVLIAQHAPLTGKCTVCRSCEGYCLIRTCQLNNAGKRCSSGGSLRGSAQRGRDLCWEVRLTPHWVTVTARASLNGLSLYLLILLRLKCIHIL